MFFCNKSPLQETHELRLLFYTELAGKLPVTFLRPTLFNDISWLQNLKKINDRET
jgi:hypothetical protein